jgi:hypothetical protein
LQLAGIDRNRTTEDIHRGSEPFLPSREQLGLHGFLFANFHGCPSISFQFLDIGRG